MKKTIVGLLSFLFALLVFSSCQSNQSNWGSNWGSFTSERTESYDHRYYANQKVSDSNIVVTIYSNETQTEVFSFTPARSSDFWGICWESDTYNIWIQSGDIGVLCYQYDDETWILNKDAQRPANIISKYD